MRVLPIFLVFGLVFSVSGKSAVKAIEPGQEVIEIGPPVKGLPPDIEEEPAAEGNDADDDEDEKPTSTAPPAHPVQPKAKDVKKTATTTTKPDTRRKSKEKNALDGDEDDAKIEKELADIYRDNADYKEDNDTTVKPIGRAGDIFALEPPEGMPVDKYRTSKDPFNCKTGDMKLAKQLDKDIIKGNALLNGPDNFVLEPDKDMPVEKFRTSKDPFECKKSAMMLAKDAGEDIIKQNAQDHALKAKKEGDGAPHIEINGFVMLTAWILASYLV